MNKHLLHLVKLSKVNQELKKIDTEIESNKSELNILCSKQDKLEKNINTEKDCIKQAIINKDKNDLLIKEISVKLDEINKKQANIKTERELKSLSIEEDIAKEQIGHANNQIQILENKEKEHKEILAELETEFENLKEEIIKEEEISNKSIAKIEKSSKSIYKNKDKVEKEIDQKIFSFYLKIKKWAHDTSVVAISDKVCTGCNMELNDKVYIEILKRENITTCSNCGRIVFDEKIDLEKLDEEEIA